MRQASAKRQHDGRGAFSRTSAALQPHIQTTFVRMAMADESLMPTLRRRHHLFFNKGWYCTVGSTYGVAKAVATQKRKAPAKPAAKKKKSK